MMTQQLQPLDALAKDPGLVPGTCRHLTTSIALVPRNLMPSSNLCGQQAHEIR